MSDPVIHTFEFSAVIQLHHGISQDHRDVTTLSQRARSMLVRESPGIIEDVAYRHHSDCNSCSARNIATNDSMCVGGGYCGVDVITPFGSPDEVVLHATSVLDLLEQLHPIFGNLHILLSENGDLQPAKKIVKCAVYFCGILRALILPSWRDIIWCDRCDMAPSYSEAFRIIDGISTMDDLMNFVALYGVCLRRSDNRNGQQATVLNLHPPSLGLSQSESVRFWTKFTVTFIKAAINLQGPNSTATSGGPYPEPTLAEFCTFIYPGWVGDTTLLDTFITSLRT